MAHIHGTPSPPRPLSKALAANRHTANAHGVEQGHPHSECTRRGAEAPTPKAEPHPAARRREATRREGTRSRQGTKPPALLKQVNGQGLGGGPGHAR